jgi:hypothetical protein
MFKIFCSLKYQMRCFTYIAENIIDNDFELC